MVEVDGINTVNPSWRIVPKHDEQKNDKNKEQQKRTPEQEQQKKDDDSHIDEYV